MAQVNGNDISIRLGVESQKFLDDMKKIQAAGEKALKDLAAAGKKSSDEYQTLALKLKNAKDATKTFENATSETSKSASDLVDRLNKMGVSLDMVTARAGPLGGFLARIGPAGLIAAGGIASVALAVTGLIKLLTVADQIADRLMSYQKQAASAGFSVEELRAFEVQLIQNNQSVDMFTSSFARLQSRVAEAANMQGELYNALKNTHPELLKNLSATDSQAETVFILARALAAETDEIERNRIAKAALDDEGIALQKTLISLADQGLPGMKDQARQLGVAITDELIEPYSHLAKQNDLLKLQFESALDNSMTIFSAEAYRQLTPVTQMLQAMNFELIRLQGGFSMIADADLQKEFGDQMRRAESLRETLAGPRGGLVNYRDIEKKLAEAEARIAKIQAEFQRRGGVSLGPGADQAIEDLKAFIDRQKEAMRDKTLDGSVGDLADPDAAARARAGVDQAANAQTALEAERQRLKTAREREAAEAQVARILMDQNDYTKALALEQARVADWLRLGVITHEQAAAYLRDQEARLKAMTPLEQARVENQKTLNALYDDTLDTLDKIEAKGQEAVRNIAALQARHAQDMAYILGDKRALESGDIDARAEDYLRADPDMTRDEAERRARSEVQALKHAEVQAAAGDVFARGMVEAANGGDWRDVFEQGFRGAMNQALYDAANNFFNMMIENLPGILNGLFGGADGGGLFGGIGNFFGSLFGGGGDDPLPRNHSGKPGGMGPNEYLTILQRGETVSRGAATSGDTFYMNFNAPGASAEGLAALQTEVRGLTYAMQQTQKNFRRSVIGVVREGQQLGEF